MTIILFQPFDLGKWFAIGFSAFLAGLLTGGNGATGSFNPSGFDPKNTHISTVTTSGGIPTPDLHQIQSQLSHLISGLAASFLVAICLMIFFVIMGFALLLFWLGSRGQFMFLDNIVRNRGAIAWPWEFYARQANSLFLFQVVFTLLSFVVILPIVGVGIVMAIPLFHQGIWPVGGSLMGFIGLGLLYVIVSIAFTIVLFLFHEFGIPIMFRKGLPAFPAFLEAMRLVRLFPGSMAVFLLLRVAFFIVLIFLCELICCLTCVIGALPYIGTLLILPVLVFVRCFTLDCLAQLDPDLDPFSVGAMPPLTGQGIPPNLPQQRG